MHRRAEVDRVAGVVIGRQLHAQILEKRMTGDGDFLNPRAGTAVEHAEVLVDAVGVLS